MYFHPEFDPGGQAARGTAESADPIQAQLGRLETTTSYYDAFGKRNALRRGLLAVRKKSGSVPSRD